MSPNPISDLDAERIVAYVMRRSTVDANFRQALLTSPRRALEDELDVTLPDSFNIRFVENRGADLTVVLPDPTRAETSNHDDARIDRQPRFFSSHPTSAASSDDDAESP
jgi:hypothetical protein